MEQIISVKKLKKIFANEVALQSVDFDIKKGEIFGFLGPSGSGKTTTIKILTGQLKPTSGDVEIFGKKITATNNQEMRKNIGIMTDNSGLYDRLSIYDNLKLYCEIYHCSLQKIDEVLELVQLSDEKMKRVSALSKGMRQRVILARALIHEPKLLFLDEPTSALDPVNTAHIYKGLRALNERGTTIFLTTHDMHEAETLCDRVAFLHNGEIQLLDTPANLKKKYAEPTMTVELKSGEMKTMSLGAEHAHLLFQYMRRDEVATIHSDEPTLGEIFVEVTGRELT